MLILKMPASVFQNLVEKKLNWLRKMNGRLDTTAEVSFLDTKLTIPKID
jgi:hypothetical protein